MKASLALFATLAALTACGTSGGATGGAGTTPVDAATADGTAATTGDTASSGDGGATTDTSATGDGKITDSTTTPSDTGTTGDTGTTSDIGTTNDTGVPVGKPVPLEQLEAELLKAMCQGFTKCESAEVEFSSAESCVAFLGVQLGNEEDGPMALIAEVKAGKITYDAAAAGNCIAFFASSCDAFKSGKAPPACKLAFVGKAADGETCSRDEICKSGRCQKGSTQSSLCPGKCAAVAKAGGACNSDSDCEGELLCIADKCAAKGGKAGAPCASQSCEAGLYCDYSSPDGSKCAAIGKEGAACLSSEACEKGLYCKNSGGQGTCAKPSATGSKCSVEGGSGGGSGFGGTFGECGTGVCLPKPGGSGGEGVCVDKAKLGQPCQGPGQCYGIDTWCPEESGVKSTCKLLPGKGGACQVPDPVKGILFTCLLPLSCDPTAKVCGDPPGVGKPCMGFCAPGLDCSEGTCTPKAKAGESCENTSCDKGLECNDGKCGKPVCGS